MSMTEFHRMVLEKVAPDLLNDLDSEDIVPYLVADEAISRDDREKIETKGTRREKVAALLDILPRRGDGAYISFQSSLTKTEGSMHLYETMKKHEERVSDQLQQELEEEKPPLQELEKHGLAVPSHAETVIGQSFSLPSLPHDTPGMIMVYKDALFDELSKKMPAGKYTSFCNQMGFSYNQAKSMLTRCKEDYNVALTALLSQWNQRMKGVTRKQLEDALDGAEVGGLRSIVKKHYEKVVAATGVVAGDGAVHDNRTQLIKQSDRSDSLHTYKEGSMDIPSRTEEMETVSPSRNTPVSQKDFYDIFLLSASKETPYFMKMKDLIQRNGWKMTTPFESKLGVPVLESIEKDVSNSSHVVYLITKEDCERKYVNHTMTVEMAFQSLTDNGLGGRLIPVFCCDMGFVPVKLRSLTGVNIGDEALEKILRKSIDVNIRKEREEKYRSVSGDQSSREMTTHMGPSTSASAGIPPQDASADGAASSSKTSGHVDPGISEMELHNLAENLGNHTNLQKLAMKLGFLYERWQQYKASNTSRDGRICIEGTHDMLVDWKKNTLQVSQKVLLNEALKDAGFAEFADDTDNNEGIDGQLTSFKHDSGSDRDDISFGGLSAPPEILARGLRAQRAYAEAAKAGTKKVFRTRLMLVGQERVGKTSLKKTLTGQGFDKNETITDGVETTSSCDISIEVTKAGKEMWSIHKKGHGNENKKEDEYKKALADEIAKMLTMTPPQDQESFEPHSRGLNPEEAEDENSKAHVDEIEKRLNTTTSQDQESLDPHNNTTLGRGLNPVEAEEFVLDNVEESDSMPNQIASLVEKKLKEQVHLKEKGTDSNHCGRGEGVSLSIWDFAGHDIYYTTHQVFLTWRAIYVIVFDLSKSLDSVVPPESRDEYYETAKGDAKSELTCLEFINFWLCSIYTYAVAPSSKTAQKSPPIFIVGTHRESVKGDAKEKKIKSAFKKICESIEKKPFECHVVPKYYAIENSLEDKDKELVALRKHIKKVAMEEPYMGEEIPIRWLKFEEALAADRRNYMSLDQTKELMQQVGIKSERELLTMLTFYHDLGKVVYYGGIEDQQSLLRDTVILNPQWLIDVFKQVITILVPGEMERNLRDAWTTLEKDGILEERLIQHMWKDFLEQKEALVELMAKFDLICEAPVERLQQEQQDGVDTEVSNETEKVVKKRYYVPSRMTSHCSQEMIAQIKSSIDFYVDFRGFLPDGLFHRLMARAVGWMGERDGEPVDLFYRHISLMVDEEHHALLEMKPPHEATIKVTVFQGAVAGSDNDGDSHKPPAPSAVKEVMDFVTRTLDSLRQHWAKRIQYDVCFLCPECSKKKLFLDCFKRKSLKCGFHRIPTAEVKSKFGMSEVGVESGNENPMMCRLLSNSIPSTMAKSLNTEEMTEHARDDTPSASGPTSSQTHGFDDVITKVGDTISDDGDLRRLGRELGVQIPVINRALETNWAGGTKTSNGNVVMLQNWAETVKSSKLIQTLRTALKRARLLEVEETCFTSSSRDSIPFTISKRLKTEETTEPLREDPQSTSGQTSSQTHGFDDVIIKVADSISDDGDLRRLGVELGVHYHDINRALETNWAGGTKTSNGNVVMLQNWAKTVESSKRLPTFRTALKRAGLFEVEETCFSSSSRGMSEEGVESGNESPVMPRRSSRLPSTKDFDDCLVAVAKGVRENTGIDTLGKNLGFSPDDIHGYIATNHKTQNVTYYGTLQMLRDWRKGQTNSTERGALKTALEESEQFHLADDLFPSS